MILGAAVGATLKAAGVSQLAVAKATGLDQGRISKMIRFEQGIRPTLDELRKIEHACGFEAGYILAVAGLVTVAGVSQGTAATSQGAVVVPLRPKKPAPTPPPAAAPTKKAAKRRPPTTPRIE